MADSLAPVSDDSFSNSGGFRTPTEGEILDSVFHHCAGDGSSPVKASKIVNFLKKLGTAGTAKCDWDFEELEELRGLLDPSGDDPEVSLDAYQACISHWVELVRRRSQSLDLPSSLQLTGQPYPPSRSSSESLEGEGGDNSKSWDKAELFTLLHEYQRQNRLLVEENRVLKQTSVTAEDISTSLGVENDSLKKRLGRIEKELDKRRSLEEDYESLRVVNAEQVKEVLSIRTRFAHLEKEKVIAEQSLTQSEDERSQLSSELSRLQHERNTSHESFISPVKANLLEEKLAESAERSTYLEECLAELQAANERVLEEKKRLEDAVTELQEQQRQASVYGRPVTHSTPVRSKSVANELAVDGSQHPGDSLQSELLASGLQVGSGSPLVGLGNGKMQCGLSNGFGADDSLDSCSSEWSSSPTSPLRMMLGPAKQNFEDKKELAMRTISAILTSSSEDHEQEEGQVIGSKHTKEAHAGDTAEVSAMYGDLETKLRKLISSKKKAARLQKELKIAHADITQGKQEVSDLRSQLSSVRDEHIAAIAKISELQKKRDMMVGECEQREKEYSAVKQELSTFREKFHKVLTEVETSHTNFEKLQGAYEKLQAAYEKLELSHKQLQQERDEALAQLTQSAAEADAIRQELAEVPSSLKKDKDQPAEFSFECTPQQVYVVGKDRLVGTKNVNEVFGSDLPLHSRVTPTSSSSLDTVDGKKDSQASSDCKVDDFLHSALPAAVENENLQLLVNFRSNYGTLQQQLHFRSHARELAESNVTKILSQLSTCPEEKQEELVQLLKQVIQRLVACSQAHGSILNETKLLDSVKILTRHIHDLRSEVFYLRGMYEGWGEIRTRKSFSLASPPAIPKISPDQHSNTPKTGKSRPTSLSMTKTQMDGGQSVVQTPEGISKNPLSGKPEAGTPRTCVQDTPPSPGCGPDNVFAVLNENHRMLGPVFHKRALKSTSIPVSSAKTLVEDEEKAPGVLEKNCVDELRLAMEKDLRFLKSQQDKCCQEVTELAERTKQISKSTTLAHLKGSASGHLARAAALLLLWLVFIFFLVVILVPLLCPIVGGGRSDIGSCSPASVLLHYGLDTLLHVDRSGVTPT